MDATLSRLTAAISVEWVATFGSLTAELELPKAAASRLTPGKAFNNLTTTAKVVRLLTLLGILNLLKLSNGPEFSTYAYYGLTRDESVNATW